MSFLIITLSFFLFVSSATACPAGWTSESFDPAICYLYVNSAMTWQSALQYCNTVQANATLPTFRTLSEYSSFHTLAKSAGNMTCSTQTWLGLLYDATSNVSSWVDGEPLSLNGFYATGNPTNLATCTQHFGFGGWWITQQCASTTYKFYCQLRTNTVMIAQTTMTAPSCSKCPVGWTLDASEICYYYVHDKNVDWQTAVNYCSTLSSGASLPIFGNNSEYQTYLALLEQMFIPCQQNVWLGLSDSLQENNFLWLTGGSPTFYPWTAASPTLSTSKNCVCNVGYVNPAASWSDTLCNRSLSFACQLRSTAICATTTTTTFEQTTTTTTVASVTPSASIARSTVQQTTTIADTSVPSTAILSSTVPNVTTSTSLLTSILSSFAFESSTVQYLSSAVKATEILTSTLNISSTKSSNSYNIESFSTTSASYYLASIIQTQLPTTQFVASSITEPASSQTVTPDIWKWAGINKGYQTDFIATSSTVQDSVPFLVANLNETTKLRLGHQFNDLIISCSYSGQFCNEKSYFKESYNPTLGNCFTFNSGLPPKFHVSRAGLPYGLRITLQTSQSEYVCTSLNAGFKVVIHENNLQAFPESQGFQLPPGAVAYFNIRQKELVRLSYPYAKCGDASYDDFIENYSVEACQRRCFQRFVSKSCGCEDPRYSLSNTNSSFCTIQQKECLDFCQSCESVVLSKCNCPAACKEVVHETVVTTSTYLAVDDSNCNESSGNLSTCQRSIKISQGFGLIYVYYDSLNYVSYSETPAYELANFWADFSGVTGLLLGLCAMSAFEVALFVYLVLQATVQRGSK